MALKENSKKVFNYVKEHEEELITAADIAAGVGLETRQVNGIVTAAFQRHKDANGDPQPLMEREPAEVQLEDGTHKPVKFIKLTDAGRAFDPEAPEEKKAE